VIRDVSFSIPLSDLTAGDYVAHAVIRAEGEVVADLRRQVAVVVGTRPTSAVSTAPAAVSPQPRDILKGNVVKQMVDQAATSSVPAIRQAASEAGGGRWSRALAALTPAPVSDPDAVRLRALARIDSGDYSSAVLDLGHVFDAQPTDARLAFVLGWAQIGAENHVGAASAFRSAVFLDPTLVPAHLALAETYLRMNQPALAAQALEAGLVRLPQSPELKRMLDSIKRK
jgi:predicted Zn-dependent protease